MLFCSRLASLAPLALACALFAQPADPVPALLAQMTVEEKVAELTQRGGGEPLGPDPAANARELDKLLVQARAGAVGSYLGACGAAHTNRLQAATLERSRLKIPALFAHDVIHGYRTIFPTPLAESSSWDPDLAERTAAVAAREARAGGVRWTYAPMVDIARDPRWGRIVEGAGEDPRLGALFAAARVRGFQGPTSADHAAVLPADRLLACAKHFAAYGAAEGGRDYNIADTSLLTLRQVYLPPFKAAADAGVASFMTAFNEVDAVPATASTFLLRAVLRDQWRSPAVVISDHSAVSELVAHGVAADRRDAARLALRAGTDIDMACDAYADHLAALVKDGLVPMPDLDAAVERVLRLKARAGLFVDPMTDETLEARVLLAPEHRALAREAAVRSMVLLKNENSTLPLKPGLRRVLLTGPLADSGRDILGTWAALGKGGESVTPLAGLKPLAARASFDLRHEPGCKPAADDAAALARALDEARQADVIIAVVGEEETLTGEGRSLSMIELPAPQQRLLEALKATGKPLVVVLMIARPLALSWVADNADAVLIAWHGGTEGGSALADVLSGDKNPSGRLTVSFPRNPGQIPIHYNHKPTGRPNQPGNRFTTGYLDVPITPLYPFGHGLAYTTFALSPVRVASTVLQPGNVLTAQVDITNTGDRPGDEVVQWYVRDPVASITRPVKELLAFSRITLGPGETRTVRLSIPVAELAFLDASGNLVLEPGEFRLHAAGGAMRTPDVVLTLKPKM